MTKMASIGVFDSGYGGLTVFREIAEKLPQYDLIYLGDNARTPYGPRSFDVVYEYTLDAVKKLFSMGCPLVILACNTASAKALRTIQQNDLPKLAPENRVLGVIRPSAEVLDSYTETGHVGVLGTTCNIVIVLFLADPSKDLSKLPTNWCGWFDTVVVRWIVDVASGWWRCVGRGGDVW